MESNTEVCADPHLLLFDDHLEQCAQNLGREGGGGGGEAATFRLLTVVSYGRLRKLSIPFCSKCCNHTK